MITLFFHTHIGKNFNVNILLHNYHTFELQFPDITNVEYDRRIFRKLKIWIKINACMSLKCSFQVTRVEILMSIRGK